MKTTDFLILFNTDSFDPFGEEIDDSKYNWCISKQGRWIHTSYFPLGSKCSYIYNKKKVYPDGNIDYASYTVKREGYTCNMCVATFKKYFEIETPKK